MERDWNIKKETTAMNKIIQMSQTIEEIFVYFY